MTLVFEELPPAFTLMRYEHPRIAEQLRQSPGSWAVIKTAGAAASQRVWASRARAGMTKAYRPVGSWEFEVRVVEGVARTYARYVGPTD